MTVSVVHVLNKDHALYHALQASCPEQHLIDAAPGNSELVAQLEQKAAKDL